MKRVMNCCALTLLALLSGCAYMDLSSQDTAVPISPKKVSAAMILSTGMDVSGTYYTEGPEDLEPDGINGALMGGWKVAGGISPKADLIFNFSGAGGHWSSQNSNGKYESSLYKLGCKYLMWKQNDHYVSVLPSVFMIDAQHRGSEYGELRNFDYHVRGLEGQLLYTYRPSKYISGSAIARGDFYNLKKNLNGTEMGPYHTSSYGLRFNLKLEAWIFHLTPEFGWEVIPIVNGETIVGKCYSLGGGIKF